jgi:cyanate lyase
MEIPQITQTLLTAKKAQGLTFADLEKVLGHDEVWIAALFYRQATASQEEANKLAEVLRLTPETVEELTVFSDQRFGPNRANGSTDLSLL